MSKAIRFSKAEMDAVQVAVVDCGGLLGLNRLEALTRLLEKMRAASDPGDNKPTLRVAPREFVEALRRHLGDRLVVYDHPSTWIKLTAALKSEPFASIEDVEELAASMTWATGTITPLTVASKGGEWLARHRAQKTLKPAQSTAGPKKITWD